MIVFGESSLSCVTMSVRTCGVAVAVSAIVWVWAGFALWLPASVLVSLVVGQVVRTRDNQVPQAHPQAEPVCPEPVTAGERADGQKGRPGW